MVYHLQVLDVLTVRSKKKHSDFSIRIIQRVSNMLQGVTLRSKATRIPRLEPLL